MARPRNVGRKLLPKNLYVQKRSGGDYYSYRNLLTGISISIGYDRNLAIETAEKKNREIADDIGSGLGTSALLSHREIVINSYPLDGYPGIYFLIKNNEVVYVGQSLDVERRIGQHRTGRKIDFDLVFIIACLPSELNQLEARYIRALKTPLNMTDPMGGFPTFRSIKLGKISEQIPNTD